MIVKYMNIEEMQQRLLANKNIIEYIYYYILLYIHVYIYYNISEVIIYNFYFCKIIYKLIIRQLKK